MESMIERIPKSILVAMAILLPLFLAILAFARPQYFTSQTYLGGLLLLEFLLAAIWMYRRVFFSVILVAFLFAGSKLPVGTVWNAARWLFLGVGAFVGCTIMVKERSYKFGLFHALAAFAVLAALVSASVSLYFSVAVLKALSLLLLFVYGSTGARLAVMGRESRFFSELLTGCEVFVSVIAVLQFSGTDPMGNPNSLGAVMGVVGAPILLWGALLEGHKVVRFRRALLYAVSMFLVAQSQARAGMIAAFISCGVLCLALRKYRLFTQALATGLILITTAAIVQPEAFSNTLSSLTSAVLYKGKDPRFGVLASRESPWQEAVASIREHFWFGTGFGTTDNGLVPSEHLGPFSSSIKTKSEIGSSYLSIATWVGMLGVLPFLLTLLLVSSKVIQTIVWMSRTRIPSHPAIPLAMVILAGMLHAAFEDWLFAPGYYLCVFFWSMAFILVDVVPSLASPDIARVPEGVQQRWTSIVSNP